MFRQRNLENSSDKFMHNVWDNVKLDGDNLRAALDKLELDKLQHNTDEIDQTPSAWDTFYKHHTSSFFKDRTWILREWPELITDKIILEVGCGVGNSLKNLKNVIACDFSVEAIKIAKTRFPKIEFFTYDLTSKDELPRADYIIVVFCISAINPKYHQLIFNKLFRSLNENGKVFFKDYGYMDMVQLRYKKEQVIGGNFYRRGDGTYTYFFELEELQKTLIKSGFIIDKIFEDKRLLINRKNKKEMYRVMIQGIFIKKGDVSLNL